MRAFGTALPGGGGQGSLAASENGTRVSSAHGRAVHTTTVRAWVHVKRAVVRMELLPDDARLHEETWKEIKVGFR